MAVTKLEALDYAGVYNSSAMIFRLVEDTYVPRATYATDVISLDERIQILEEERGVVTNAQNNE